VSPPTNIGSLLDRQARRWEIQHPRGSEDAPRPPCVAISRTPYAGGASVGRAVAERLDYGLFGREILDAIAEERGIRRQIVQGVDEQVLTAIERFVSEVLRLRSITETEYLRSLMRVVGTLGNRGASVLLGRGAAQILPAERALRVLVVAPAAIRAQRLAQAEGLEGPAVGRRLAELDAARAHFSRHHFGVEQNDPTLYDLVVNTGTLSYEDAAELVVEALGRRFPAARPVRAA
jgi:cytidylate kinase